MWASFVGVDGGEQYQGEIPLRKAGLSALFDPFFLVRAVREVKRSRLEAVVSTSLIAGLHGALLKLATGLPFWMDEHNVEWHCSKRYGHRFWWLIFLLEGFILKLADHVTCVSEKDRARLISCYRLNPAKLAVAPNGVDYHQLSMSQPGLSQRKHKRVLFFGVLDYPPNTRAVQVLAEKIAPLVDPDIEIVVAG